jgi:hypothetical protein
MVEHDAAPEDERHADAKEEQRVPMRTETFFHIRLSTLRILDLDDFSACF